MWFSSTLVLTQVLLLVHVSLVSCAGQWGRKSFPSRQQSQPVMTSAEAARRYGGRMATPDDIAQIKGKQQADYSSPGSNVQRPTCDHRRPSTSNDLMVEMKNNHMGGGPNTIPFEPTPSERKPRSYTIPGLSRMSLSRMLSIFRTCPRQDSETDSPSTDQPKSGTVAKPRKTAAKVANMADLKSKLTDAGNKLIVIDFYTTWCGPCKTILPKIEELAAEYQDVVFLKVDADENEKIANEYGGVYTMPTFVFVKNSEMVEKFSGANFDRLKATVIAKRS